jgi:hypothetical protein
VELRAVRLTAGAARRLAPPGSGRVHSVYAHTVNLELDGPDRWLSLHGPGPLASPFGIACATLPAGAPAVGAPVEIGPGPRLRAGALRIRLDGARVATGALPSAGPRPSLARCLDAARAGEAPGILEIVAALARDEALPGTWLARLAGPALAHLARATGAGETAACIAAATRLLGLGPGLTPAGDDCVMGWITGLRVGGAAGRRLAARVERPLLAGAAARTGPLSRAFLAAALRGEVAEPVWAFVAAPDAPRLAGLLAMGATSGRDFLGGYLLAWEALGGAETSTRAARLAASGGEID